MSFPNIYFNNDLDMLSYEEGIDGKYHGRVFRWDDELDEFDFHAVLSHSEILEILNKSLLQEENMKVAM